uniref:AsIV-cont00021-ORF1 n=1 Tax=Apophua simplicipes ichnovirus TaxID=1329648 RepID=S5DSY0_9VIRU|nr:AsIV-cont00021-ORF1 [Apophua simplicipes ichnovirus]
MNFYFILIVCFLHSIITIMATMSSLMEVERKIDFIIVKIDLYNMYLKHYWGQKELSDSKILEIERILILKENLVKRLFTHIRHLRYVPFSVVSVFFEERVFIRHTLMNDVYV